MLVTVCRAQDGQCSRGTAGAVSAEAPVSSARRPAIQRHSRVRDSGVPSNIGSRSTPWAVSSACRRARAAGRSARNSSRAAAASRVVIRR